MKLRILALAFSLVLAACGGDDGGSGGAKPTSPAANPVTETPTPEPTPEPVPEVTPPSAPAADAFPENLGSGDAATGGPLYVQYCASCHGDKGCGGGPLGEALNPKPALHCDGNYMNPKTDEHLYKVIAQGGTAVGLSPLMAPWLGTLDEAQIVDVVAFVRSLADPPHQGAE